MNRDENYLKKLFDLIDWPFKEEGYPKPDERVIKSFHPREYHLALSFFSKLKQKPETPHEERVIYYHLGRYGEVMYYALRQKRD